MKIVLKLSIALFILLSSGDGYSQKCKNYDLNCYSYGYPFKYSSQSKSGPFIHGYSSEFKIICFKGMEYSVSVCCEKELGKISFKIKEDTPEKNVLFDSSLEDDYVLDKQFYVDETKKLIIEVISPSAEEDKNEKKPELVSCVGVIVEYNKPPKTGF